LKHRHAQEDEFIFVIASDLTVHEGATTTQIGPGDVACFPAGAETGHFLENQSEADVTHLVVGTRAQSDVITFPDQARRLIFDHRTHVPTYQTLDGQPADPPKG
jgi:uncharacterized cupin superfamily protein